MYEVGVRITNKLTIDPCVSFLAKATSVYNPFCVWVPVPDL